MSSMYLQLLFSRRATVNFPVETRDVSLFVPRRIFQFGVRRYSAVLVLVRDWRGRALSISPTERLKLRQQMAAAVGKNQSVSLCVLLEVKD